MDAKQYRSALKNTRDMFANLKDGTYTAGRKGEAVYLVSDQETEAEVQIVYNLADLYIRGFIVNDLAYGFSGSKSLFSAPAMGGNFSFTEDYQSMGMDRNKKWKISLEDVTNDLRKLSEISPTTVKNFPGERVAHLIVGFAEALRFKDVENAIVAGSEFDPKTALDWKVRTNNANDVNVTIRKAA